jgi:hypothetical protein
VLPFRLSVLCALFSQFSLFNFKKESKGLWRMAIRIRKDIGLCQCHFVYVNVLVYFLLTCGWPPKSINIKSFQPFLMTTFTALKSYICRREERVHVLVNILAMGSLVWWCCHQLTIIIRLSKGLLLWMSAVIYSKISI